MVELTLPKNSQVQKGKTWPKPQGATRLREYRVYRYDPDTEDNPRLDTYFIDLDDCGPMVLDGLLWI
jgi:succinate dehydrogenase / fumarate reductase iron-sulfur subunit